jgi:hypothetical protein
MSNEKPLEGARVTTVRASDDICTVEGRFVRPEGDALIKAQELKARKGRLTITEAIQTLIAKAEYINLLEPVKAGEIPSYAPGSNKRMVGNTDNCSGDEELLPAELNAWLGKNHQHVEFRFSEVGAVDAAEMSLTDIRVAAILQTAANLGYKPMAIEYGGKAAIKSECLEKMAGAPHRFTDSTFDAAWKIAAKRKLVEVEDSEVYRNK